MQRLSGELSAADRKLELLAADLAAERDRVAAQAALLECKVRQALWLDDCKGCVEPRMTVS